MSTPTIERRTATPEGIAATTEGRQQESTDWNLRFNQEISVCKIPHGGGMFIQRNITIMDALEEIRDGTHASAVANVRDTIEIYDKEAPEVKVAKCELPAFLLSGRIEGRVAKAMDEGRFHHSGLLQLDFDKLDDPAAIRDQIAQDPHVLAAWLSPSGDGVKGLLVINPAATEAAHLASFLAAQAYWHDRGLTLDKACKNSNRLCFASHDPDLRFNDEAVPLATSTPPKAAAAPKPKPSTTSPGLKLGLNAIIPQPPHNGIHDWMIKSVRSCEQHGMTEADTFAKLKAYDGTLRRPFDRNELENACREIFATPSSSTATTAGTRAVVREIPEDVFPVPGGGISNNAAAEIIFPALAESRRMFMRGNVAYEIATTEKTDHLVPVSAERFCSVIEMEGRRVARREMVKDEEGKKRIVWRSTTFPVSPARIQLQTDAARTHLPPIRQLTNCPIITPDGILGRGYHDHAGGTYISTGSAPERIPKGTAFRALLDILSDFNFATDSDRSRAFASLISPALKMGGWIEDDFPLDFSEADQSQSGKTFRQKLVCRIYNEIPTSITITTTKGGVGSVDESIATALVKGRPFITLGNIRGKIDSTIMEEALRGSGRVNCRTLRHSAEVDCSPFLWQLSTNGAELTRDLANRAIVTRIRKQPSTYEWKQYPEGNLESHVIANQSFYLGCVFSIIEEWHLKGVPRTNESRHDFKEWCRALDAIVQMFTLAPLLDGHKEQQERTANPQLQWLREVILAAKKTQHGCELFTHDLVNIAEDHGIEFPGNPHSKDEPYIRAGRILGKIFRDAESDEITVDRFTFTRTEAPDYSEKGGYRTIKKYTIREQ